MEEDTETEATVNRANMADMAKIKSHLQSENYKEEREGWAKTL